MHWCADGLCYGIRRNVEVDLATGRDVIVNGTADYVPQLRKIFPDAHVIRFDGEQAGPSERAVTIDGAQCADRDVAVPHDADATGAEIMHPVAVAAQGPRAILGRRE